MTRMEYVQIGVHVGQGFSCAPGAALPRPAASSCCAAPCSQNTVVEDVQQLPWRLCYARDKAQPAPTAAASAGADALQVRSCHSTHRQAMPDGSGNIRLLLDH